MTGVKERFPTYDTAIAEIRRLEEIVNQLEAAHRLTTHKRLGRPAKSTGNISKKKLDQPLKSFPFLAAWIERHAPVGHKGGRPRKKTIQQMTDDLKTFDYEKQLHAKAKRKKSVTDKEYIEFQINTHKEMKAWPEHRRRAKIALFHKRIKYYRDETGIRQKRKTP